MNNVSNTLVNDSGRLFGSRFRGQFARWDLKTDFGFGRKENSGKIPLSAALIPVWFHITHCLGQKSGFYSKTWCVQATAVGGGLNKSAAQALIQLIFPNSYERSSISFSEAKKERMRAAGPGLLMKTQHI